MARKRLDAVRPRRSFLSLLLLVLVVAALVPPSRPAAASGGGGAAPPPPAPLSIPASWYETAPAASIDYVPASSQVTPAGQYALTVPIDAPPGRGMGPSLSLVYTSTQADGLLGVGWSLGGLSEIHRCTKTLATSGVTAGIRYLTGDDYCLDGERLIEIDDGYAPGCMEYRTERDGFARILGCGDTAGGPAWFRVWTKGGEVLFYEAIHHLGLGGPFDETDVLLAWPLRDRQDRSGNLVRFHYEVHQNTGGPHGFYYRPLEIEYTGKAAEPPFVEEEAGVRKVVFDYQDRPDPSNRYLGGIRYGMPGRLASVTLIAPNPDAPAVVGRYQLSYTESKATGRSLLTQIQRCDGREGQEKACLWAKQLSWWESQRPDFEEGDVWTDHVTAPEGAFFSVLDADGDGRDDLLARLRDSTGLDDEPEIYLFRGSGGAADHGLLPPIVVNDPLATTSFRHVDLDASRPADIDGDGSFELLAFVRPPAWLPPYEPGFQWFRWSAAHHRFEPFGAFLAAGGPSAAQLIDFDGDGRIDMLRAEPAPAIPARWLFHRNTGGDLSAFQTTPFLAFEPARAVGVDLDGDGRGELFTVDPVEALDPAHLVPLGLDPAGQLAALGTDWVTASQGPSSLLPTFVDINGDGLRDALSLVQDPKKVRLNTGRGLLPPAPIDLPGTLVDTSVTDSGVRVADFDGDGREDILSLEALNGAGQHVMRLLLSRPGGPVEKDLGLLSGTKAPVSGWATTQLGDFNGDGWLDIVRMPSLIATSEGGTTTGDIRINVLLQKATAPGNGVNDLLFEVKDEHSTVARESVFYTTAWGEPAPAGACAYPQLCLRRGFPVVRMLGATTIEPPATRWMLYDYEDPRADVRGRGFLGFGAVGAFDKQLRSRTRTTFDHHTRVGERYPFAGLPAHTLHIAPLFELPADGTEAPPLPQSPVRGHITSIHRSYTDYLLNGGAT